MLDELQSIDENDTWMLTTLRTRHHIIGLKWVYKVKKDECDAIVNHKARLVAKSYVQCVGWTSRKSLRRWQGSKFCAADPRSCCAP